MDKVRGDPVRFELAPGTGALDAAGAFRAGGAAFDPQTAGHGNRAEPMSGDPAADFRFPSNLFGGSTGGAMDRGDMGTYRIFGHDGSDIGGMTGLGTAPQPRWLACFGVNGTNSAARRITDPGGAIRHGPALVPGDAHIVAATDPRDARFALAGPQEETP